MQSKERMNARITIASPADTEGIQKVFHHTWLATYPNKEYGITVEDIEERFNDAYTKERLAIRRRQIAMPLPGELLLVAKVGGEVVGVCRVEKDAQKNELRGLYVLPAYQGQGIGRQLWAGVQNFFDPAKDTLVDVAVYNENAIKFYSSLGFIDTGERFSKERLRMKSGTVIPEMRMKMAAK